MKTQRPRPRTRTHRCPPEHKHAATTTCFTRHGCGCDACYDHQRDIGNRRLRLTAYGQWQPMVPIGPVTEHVRYLRGCMLGIVQIAKLAGVAKTTVYEISCANPTHRYVQPEVARKLMAVQPSFDKLAVGLKINGRGTLRRLQALEAIGWTQLEVANRTGLHPKQLNAIGTHPKITVGTYVKIAEFYEWASAHDPRENGVSETSYLRTRLRAKRKGYVAPFGWDDIDADDAPVEVEHVSYYDHFDEVAVDLTLQGRKPRRLSPPETDECVRRLHAKRMSDAAIGYRLGMSERQVERIRHGKLNLPGWDKTDQYTNIETDRRAAA